MSELLIYLGSCGENEAEKKEDASSGVSAPTLQQAAKQNSDSGPWHALHITVSATDFATTWSNPMDLASFRLQEAAVVTVTIVTGNSVSTNTENDLQPIHTAFLLAGLQGTSERKEPDGTRVLTAQKAAQTSQPASAKAISLSKKQGNMASTAVTISLDDDADMIDEDDLLQDEGDLAPDMNGISATAAAGDDCGGRTACDDCTCGRAEQEKGGAVEATQKKQPIKTSSCGKCGLGDAFRCASCPYLGKPAFKPGEEHLVLDLQDDF